MKTKDEKIVKKIELNKLKVASLSRDQKMQVLGGVHTSCTPNCHNNIFL